MKESADSMPSEDLFPGSQTAVFSQCVHMVGGLKELSGEFFIRTLILFMKVPLPCPGHPPKAPPANTITLGVRSQHIYFGGSQKFSL